MPVCTLPQAPLIVLRFWSENGAVPPVQVMVTFDPLRVTEVILMGCCRITGTEKFEVCTRPLWVPMGSAE